MNANVLRSPVISMAVAVSYLLGTSEGALAGQDNWPSSKVGEPTPKVASMPPELAKNLANFDDLDFNVYTGQQWENLHRSHGKDIIVHSYHGASDPGWHCGWPVDSRNGLPGWYVYQAYGPREQYCHSANGKGVPPAHGNPRSLDQGGCDGCGVPVLGQRHSHAADRCR